MNYPEYPILYEGSAYNHPIWRQPSEDGKLGWIYEHPYGVHQHDPTPYPDHPVTQYLSQQRWLQSTDNADVYEIMGKAYVIPKTTLNNQNRWVNDDDYNPVENGAMPLVRNRTKKRRPGWDVPICKLFPRTWWLVEPAITGKQVPMDKRLWTQQKYF